MKIYCYPKCSTCTKALKWLEDKGLNYELVNISLVAPTKDELEWAYNKYNKWGRVFNTSGIKYREGKVSEIVKQGDEAALYKILVADGMIVKRPFLVIGEDVVTGFREDEYEKATAHFFE